MTSYFNLFFDGDYMKKYIGMLLLFGFCGTSFASSFFIYDMKSCDFWTPNNGGQGYLCDTWPRSYQVPDATSIAKQLDTLEKRIIELENKIKQLEDK